jgi:hypothetical protein
MRKKQEAYDGSQVIEPVLYPEGNTHESAWNLFQDRIINFKYNKREMEIINKGFTNIQLFVHFLAMICQHLRRIMEVTNIQEESFEPGFLTSSVCPGFYSDAE